MRNSSASALSTFAAFAGLFAAAGASVSWATSDVAREATKWNQVDTIRGAAERLGRLHRAKGAKAAYELIDNCYRTHSLSDTYGEGFEICITQDYLETRTLMQVYSRMPPDALEKAGVPSPSELASSMSRRISSAFGHYKITQDYADRLKRLVDQHGFPVFVTLVFPEAVKAVEDQKAKAKKK